MRWWQVGSVVVVCGSIGCGGRAKAPTTAWSESGAPMTIIEFQDDTSWPFEIAQVRIVLDGETLLDHATPAGERAKYGFEVPLEDLPHGDHTLDVAVEARFSSTRMDASEGCAVRWRDNRTFVVGSEPVGVRIVAETDDVTSRFIDRLDIDIAVAGAHAIGGRPQRELVAHAAVCRDDGPLPFGDHELSRDRFAHEPFPFR
jgi:hypothetical protein